MAGLRGEIRIAVQAKIGSSPRTNRWKLREFVVADLDVERR
jgi:hypothetical protein